MKFEVQVTKLPTDQVTHSHHCHRRARRLWWLRAPQFPIAAARHDRRAHVSAGRPPRCGRGSAARDRTRSWTSGDARCAGSSTRTQAIRVLALGRPVRPITQSITRSMATATSPITSPTDDGCRAISLRRATASVPWTMDVARNQIVWFDATCQVDPTRSHLFPYRQRAWVEPRERGRRSRDTRDARARICALRSDGGGGRDREPERFSFGLGAGWYEWGAGGHPRLVQPTGWSLHADGARGVVRGAVSTCNSYAGKRYSSGTDTIVSDSPIISCCPGSDVIRFAFI